MKTNDTDKTNIFKNTIKLSTMCQNILKNLKICNNTIKYLKYNKLQHK